MIWENDFDLIRFYYELHLTQKEILVCLAQNHNIIISRSTLKRRLKALKLTRRVQKSDSLDVLQFITQELERSGRLHGYRWMYLKCLKNGYVVDRESVRLFMHILDADGVKQRQRKRLKRRVYFNRGPNFTWHVDSNDKLRPYGLFINGCIDGFSRLIIWLKVSGEGKARGVACHFLKAIECRKGCPKVLRTDLGVENTKICKLQPFLRRNHEDDRAGERSVVRGDSRLNQRIESWWNILRKENLQFWMDIFGRLKEDGLFCGDILDKALIRFCFQDLIQREFDEVVEVWNTHTIRRHSNTGLPCGKPVLLYTVPQLYGFQDQLCTVDQLEVSVSQDEIREAEVDSFDSNLMDLCRIVLAEKGMNSPKDPYEAATDYDILRTEIKRVLYEF